MQVLQLLLKDALGLNSRANYCFPVKCPVDRLLQTRNIFLNEMLLPLPTVGSIKQTLF